MNNITLNSQLVKKHRLLFLSLVAYIAIFFFASFYNFSNYVLVVVVAIWLPAVFITFQALNRVERNFIIVSVIFLIIDLFYNLVGYSNLSRGFLLRDISWIMSGIISVYAMKLLSNKELSSLFVVISMIIVLFLFVLIRIGSAMNIAGDDSSEVSNAWNSSMFMLINGFCLMAVIHVKPVLPRLLFALAFLLTLYLNVFILQRATNIIFTIAEIILILIFCLKNKFLIWLFSVVVGVFIVLVVNTDMIISVLDVLSSVVPDRVAMRLDSIAWALQYESIESGGGSLAVRNNLMVTSWNTFTSGLDTVLFGAGATRGSGHDVIGQHSFILDTLASYGILGGVLMFLYFKNQYALMMSGLKNERNNVLFSQCVVVFVIYILRNYFGKMAVTNINFVIMIYFPLLINYIQNNKTNNKLVL